MIFSLLNKKEDAYDGRNTPANMTQLLFLLLILVLRQIVYPGFSLFFLSVFYTMHIPIPFFD